MKRLFGYLCVLFIVFFMCIPVYAMDGGISVDAGGEMIVSSMDMDCPCGVSNTIIESYLNPEALSYIAEAVYAPNCRDVRSSTDISYKII